MTVIPYHLSTDRDAVLSLTYANPNRDTILDVEQDKRTSLKNGLLDYQTRIKEVECGGREMYTLYTAELHPNIYPQYDESDYSIGEIQLIENILAAFDSIEVECAIDGVDLCWYKQMQIERISRIIDQTEFDGRVPEVGGRLLSNFISTHPLPNANYRVGITLLDMYLQVYDSSFEMPDTGVTGTWFNWTEEYVQQSKELMTLGRKGELLNYLHEHGCTGVRRDGGNIISFEEYDFRVSNYFDHYVNKTHQEQSIGFVYGLLERSDSHDLMAKQDQGVSTFVEGLN